ncbi:MAG: dienelactone hydrolase family protein [Cyclobacteriaceae bacterium]
MKLRLILLSTPILAILIYVLLTQREQDLPTNYITVCSSAPQQFAGFTSDASFVNIHQTPEALQDYEYKGKMIKYNVLDGKQANAYFIKSATESNDYLFVIHEWWGLNDHIKKESDRLYSELGNINVIALDLYDGKVATTRENAAKYMNAVTDKRAKLIIAGAKKLTNGKSRIFTIGWCFGGGWSLQTGIELGKRAAGTIMFYGMPEKDVDRLKMLKCDLLGLFAAKEKWIAPEVVAQFEKDLFTAKIEFSIKSYQAEHGFANPSNPRFDKEATDDAYKKVMAFIQVRR